MLLEALCPRKIVGIDGLPLESSAMDSQVSRRAALGMFGALAASVCSPSWSQEAPARSDDFWIRPRYVNLRHPSGDRIKITYWSDGEIINHAWREISWFMRDRVENQAVYMHPVLLDIIYGMCGWLDYFGIKDPLTHTSGYRTVRRNARIEGAARDSEHTKGGAGDLSHSRVSPTQMSKFGVWLGGGGVGWYPSKGFTHVDRGRLRVWRG